jgi:hypothetical protein
VAASVGVAAGTYPHADLEDLVEILGPQGELAKVSEPLLSLHHPRKIRHTGPIQWHPHVAAGERHSGAGEMPRLRHNAELLSMSDQLLKHVTKERFR